MRVAIYNPFLGECVAETELSRRIYLASINLGWEAAEVSSSVEIKSFNPDIVLALHFRVPKLVGFPTYGCMWNPPAFCELEDIFIKNILSYDGYLSSSLQVNLWLEDILYSTAKKFIIAPFYTSCNETSYQAPNLQNPHLVYIGSNWDGPRFKELFLKLDQEDYMEVYGKKDGWQYLTSSYKGALLFDGVTVVKTLNQAGVGLCLHRDEHCKAHIPSMRIFEIAASGAVAICNEHPFIQENFGDSVLYLSSNLNTDERVRQISEHLRWIKTNPKEAFEMSRKAHRIFVDNFSLEKLLLGLLPYHKQLVEKKGFTAPQHLNTSLVKKTYKKVQIIVRVGGRDISKIKRALDSIAAQTYPNIGVIIVRWREVEKLEILLKEYSQRLSIEVLNVEDSSCRSTSLWAGINAVASEYFGILDDDDLLHCNHVDSLVSLLDEYDEYGVAYSGSIHVWEPDNDGEVLQLDLQQIAEPASLTYFNHFEMTEVISFRNFITTNSFIARSSLIDKNIRKDPQLNVFEDFFLLLNFSKKTRYIFSYEATCEFYHRVSMQDNSVFESRQLWDEATHRIERMMWNQEFPSKQTLGQFRAMQAELEKLRAQLQSYQTELGQSQAQLQQTQAELERSQFQVQDTQTELQRSQAQVQHTQAELVQSQAIISGMESSKFWKLRTAWFRLKQALSLTDSSPPQITDSLASTAITEVNNISKIKFKVASKNTLNGCLDKINGSNVTESEVSSATPITASGWAILPEEGRPADRVIITYGRKNSLVGVAPVNLERLDVVVALDNPAYRNCGWSITLNSSSLPAGKVVLKAWAYNAVRKEATQLNFISSNLQVSYLSSRLKYYYAVLKVRGVRYALAKLLKKIYYKLFNWQLPTDVSPLASANDELYSRWLSKNFPREADLRRMAEEVEIFDYKPLISVVMPVFNPPEKFLREAIESVLNQVYPYWELCIADDASTQPYVKSVVEDYISKDPRIKVVFRDENGHISRASNSAIEIATGEFISLLDHDDVLTPDALYEVALLLNQYPDADMIYSDEDKVDEHNQLKEPFFKPDWCPDSFLSRMYTCHLGTYRRSLVTEIGGFRVGYEGSQDYDLVLRLTEKTENIFHIPKVLYHWRSHADSTARSLSSKDYATDAAKKAILDALYRRNEPGKVIPVVGGHHIVRYEIKDLKLVSIIIPTKNLGGILDNCLTSIFEKTTYTNYEVLVIDNGSTEAETQDVINKWKFKEPNRFRCKVLNIPFNFSKINNYAVEQAKGEYLLFLNNDTEVITPDWLEAMVEQAQRQSIGAVGALLLYPDNTIQHAGVVCVGGLAGHSHKYYSSDSPGYFCQIPTINNYSAVTAACLMCRREVFKTVGGFEEELTVAFNDIDLCFKMIEKGYRNIYLPHVVLYHYESKSRGFEDTTEKQIRFIREVKYMQNKWKNFIAYDPCYSINLTREREDYSIKI